MANGDWSEDDHHRDAGGRFVSEITRLGELAAAESRRIDGLLKAQETAVNAALAAAEKAVAAALAASEKAVNKAEIAQQRVNEGQNEFRGTLADQARMLMPRVETESLVRELRSLIDALATSVAGLRSRLDAGPPEMGALQARMSEKAGSSAAVEQGWKYVLAVGSLLIGIAGLALAFNR